MQRVERRISYEPDYVRKVDFAGVRGDAVVIMGEEIVDPIANTPIAGKTCIGDSLISGRMSMASGSWRFDRQPSRPSSEEPPYNPPHGGRSWWAHLEFTCISIKLTILPKKFENLREAGES